MLGILEEVILFVFGRLRLVAGAVPTIHLHEEDFPKQLSSSAQRRIERGKAREQREYVSSLDAVNGK